MALGAASAGGSGAVGSGAFTATSAERDVEVDLETDSDAYLGLFELGQGGRSSKQAGQLTFSFPGDGESTTVGLGSDSVYEFDEDADESGAGGLFKVVNQGATTVDVFAIEVDASADVPSVGVFDVDDPNRPTLDGAPEKVTLGPGDAFEGGLRIDTHGVTIRSQPYEVTLTLEARTR